MAKGNRNRPRTAALPGMEPLLAKRGLTPSEADTVTYVKLREPVLAITVLAALRHELDHRRAVRHLDALADAGYVAISPARKVSVTPDGLKALGEYHG